MMSLRNSFIRTYNDITIHDQSAWSIKFLLFLVIYALGDWNVDGVGRKVTSFYKWRQYITVSLQLEPFLFIFFPFSLYFPVFSLFGFGSMYPFFPLRMRHRIILSYYDRINSNSCSYAMYLSPKFS